MEKITNRQDLGMARTFLEHFPGRLTIQAIPDRGREGLFPKSPYLDYPRQKLSSLVKLNNQGYGIFFTVNETDGQGRKAENIIRVRALFVDLDGAPVDPVLDASLEPHIIVESSPGKYHAYWLLRNVPLDNFKPLQQALARRFNGDPSVADLPRLMRVPGFFHQKVRLG